MSTVRSNDFFTGIMYSYGNQNFNVVLNRIENEKLIIITNYQIATFCPSPYCGTPDSITPAR